MKRKSESSYSSEDSAVESDMDHSDDDNYSPSYSSTRSKRIKYSSMSSSISGCRMSEDEKKSEREGRVLMRPWLEQQANSGEIPGLYWYNKERKEIRIPWKHGSRSGWSIDDCRVYYAWAMHTGKVNSSPMQPKKWKANFRCALNSLPDVQELTQLYQKRGTDPYKVYVLMPEIGRKKNPTKKTKKSRKENRIKEEIRIKEENYTDEGYSYSPEYSENMNEYYIGHVKTEPTCNYNAEQENNCYLGQQSFCFDRPNSLIPTVVEEISQENCDDNLFDLDDLTNLETLDDFAVSPRSESSSTSSHDSGILDTNCLLEEICEDDDIVSDLLQIPCWEQTDEAKSLFFGSNYEILSCNFENIEVSDLAAALL
jgi:hypothetical protein